MRCGLKGISLVALRQKGCVDQDCLTITPHGRGAGVHHCLC